MPFLVVALIRTTALWLFEVKVPAIVEAAQMDL